MVALRLVKDWSFSCIVKSARANERVSENQTLCSLANALTRGCPGRSVKRNGWTEGRENFALHNQHHTPYVVALYGAASQEAVPGIPLRLVSEFCVVRSGRFVHGAQNDLCDAALIAWALAPIRAVGSDAVAESCSNRFREELAPEGKSQFQRRQLRSFASLGTEKFPSAGPYTTGQSHWCPSRAP
jgi:hypothetical protein